MPRKDNKFMRAEVRRDKKGLIGELLFLSLSLLLICIMIIFSGSVATSAKNALMLCGRTLIPAIFPFLVINGVLIRSGLAEGCARLFGGLYSRLFKQSGSLCSAFLIGAICGFPSGAAAVAECERAGLCSKEDASRALFTSSSASPAFVILAVGKGILGSLAHGVMLWLIQIFAILALSFIQGLFSCPSGSCTSLKRKENRGFFNALALSLKEGAGSMLSICGAVIFFSIISGYLSTLPFLPQSIKCLLSCALEITGGVSLCASCFSFPLSFIVIAGAIGWSGISVHSQVSLVTNGDYPMGKYIVSKLCCSLLTSLFAAASVFFGFI